MSVGNKLPSELSKRAWAAEVLGTAAYGAPADFTAAFLRRLAEEDFVPPTDLRSAWEAVRSNADSSRRLPAFERSVEEQLQAAIEEFAARFFALPRPKRVERWHALFVRAKDLPGCRARLEALQPGLKIDPNELGPLEPQVAALAKASMELFVLPPSRRALRRREFMRTQLTGDEAAWLTAAGKLLKQAPALAGLAPDLVEQLANWNKTTKLAKRNRRKRREMTPRRITTQPVAGSRWFVGVAVLIALAVTNLIRSGANYQHSNSVPPYFQPPGDELERLLRRPIENRGKPDSNVVPQPLDASNPATTFGSSPSPRAPNSRAVDNSNFAKAIEIAVQAYNRRHRAAGDNSSQGDAPPTKSESDSPNDLPSPPVLPEPTPSRPSDSNLPTDPARPR